MKESKKEAERWWKQAQNDLGYAELGLSTGYYAQTCFQCHQVAEKALKALHYFQFDKRSVLHGTSWIWHVHSWGSDFRDPHLVK